ncbi:MAG: hypothetical protein HKO62_10315 [Gammaproteobacteria bacterium]|nr:hypothetical protein [Gammaproteobacteria bacterium]
MAASDDLLSDELRVDTDNLYREDTVTDLRAASIRRMIPITIDGSDDPSREIRYVGDTTLMTQMGPLPVQFLIEAASLAEACEKFPAGVREAVERLNERAKEMAREEASRIVVPSGMPPEAAGGMPGGVPGSSKLVLK